MVKVKIISGPQAGQENLVEIKPVVLMSLAQEGWRWEIDWETIVSEAEMFEWAKFDMTGKIISCLFGGREIVFKVPGKADQKWFGECNLELAEKVEDTIVNSGRNVVISEDTEDRLVILGDSITQ